MGSVSTPLWSPMTSCATLSARHCSGGPHWVLELSGEADLATSGLVRMVVAQMDTVTSQGIVVDVSKLVFCDVATAQLITASHGTMPVTVQGATGSVRRVFELLDALQRQRVPRFLPPVAQARVSRRPMVRV